MQVVDNSSLPLIIEKLDAQPIDSNKQLEILGLFTNNLEVETVNNSINVTANGTSNNGMVDSKTMDLLANLLGVNKLTDLPEEILGKVNEITGISEELINKVNKLVETITPLVSELSNEGIKKDDILLAIRSKLNLDTSEDSNIDKNIIGIENSRTILDKSVVKENQIIEFSTTIKSDISNNEISEEDKVLNKLLGIESDSFSQTLSRITTRNEVTASTNVAPSTVFKDTMDEDIIKNVRFMVKNQIQELKVKIYPKELGEMTIKILSEEGIMKAEIKATSKETYNLLNSNINEIKKALSNENIKIHDVNIALYNDDTTYYSGQGFEGRFNDEKRNFVANENGVSKMDLEDEVIEELNIENSNVDLLV